MNWLLKLLGHEVVTVWGAVDQGRDEKIYLYNRKPQRHESVWFGGCGSNVGLIDNTLGLTFEDEPVQVKILVKRGKK
jgi:hypothetical protein